LYTNGLNNFYTKCVNVYAFPILMLLNKGMPQGSLLGPISFKVHIDDFSLLCNALKYVDDTENIGSNSFVSDMQTLIIQLVTFVKRK